MNLVHWLFVLHSSSSGTRLLLVVLFVANSMYVLLNPFKFQIHACHIRSFDVCVFSISHRVHLFPSNGFLDGQGTALCIRRIVWLLQLSGVTESECPTFKITGVVQYFWIWLSEFKSLLLIGNQMLIIASHFSPGFGDHLTREFCPKWYKLACRWRVLSDCYWTQYGWKKLLCSPGGSDCYNGSGRSNAVSAVFLLWFSAVNATKCRGCAVLTLCFVNTES